MFERVCMCVSEKVYMICVHEYKRVCVCLCIYVCVSMYVCVLHVHTYIRTYVCICIHV